MGKEYLLKIVIRGADIKLQLLKEQILVDNLKWQDANSLSLELLKGIDKLLEKNRIKKEQLNNIEVDSDEATYSSTRIAKTVAEAGRYCLTN